MDTFSTTGKHMCTEILAGQVTTTAWDYRHKIDSSCHYAYQYDDIGNRQSAVEPNGAFTYAANALNQYTQLNRTIEQSEQSNNFSPAYDLDGNQTLVKTSTGVWQVTYNGENRPIRWVRGNTVVTMDFDSMGRRTFYREAENDVEVSHSRFFYDGYLMIQQLNHDSPYSVQKEFIWDPTEPVATKPLVFRQNGMDTTYLTHDGNKNVADIIRAAPDNDSVGHYEYAPFGAVKSAVGLRAMDNPFRFSSEFSDDVLGLDYYNYRHYEPGTGRWTTRDPAGEEDSPGLYLFVQNAVWHIDRYGLTGVCCEKFLENVKNGIDLISEWTGYVSLLTYAGLTEIKCKINLKCEVCASDRQRSSHTLNIGGDTVLEEKRQLFGLLDSKYTIRIRLCTDDQGHVLGDRSMAGKILRHELTHASDLCRRRRNFTCGDFTIASLEKGEFDELICSELHAYSKQHIGVGVPALSKEKVIAGTVNSVLSACGISRVKPERVDADFAVKLEERARKKYDSCIDWGEK